MSGCPRSESVQPFATPNFINFYSGRWFKKFVTFLQLMGASVFLSACTEDPRQMASYYNLKWTKISSEHPPCGAMIPNIILTGDNSSLKNAAECIAADYLQLQNEVGRNSIVDALRFIGMSCNHELGGSNKVICIDSETINHGIGGYPYPVDWSIFIQKVTIEREIIISVYISLEKWKRDVSLDERTKNYVETGNSHQEMKVFFEIFTSNIGRN